MFSHRGHGPPPGTHQEPGWLEPAPASGFSLGHRGGRLRPAVLGFLGASLLLLWSTDFWTGGSTRPVTWQRRTTFIGHDSAILAVAFSPDGLRLASGDFEGQLLIWDWQSGRQLAALHGDGARLL